MRCRNNRADRPEGRYRWLTHEIIDAQLPLLVADIGLALSEFHLVKDRVFASLSMLTQPFVPAHLHQAVRIMSDIADAIDDDLARKLGGRTAFEAE